MSHIKELEDNSKGKEETLYLQISKLYNDRKTASRLLYIARIKDSDEKGEKYTRENIVSLVTSQVKGIFKQVDSEDKTNCIIIFLDSTYAIIMIENNHDTIIEFVVALYNDIKINAGSHISANIIGFVEENPNFMIPPWYVYESNLKDGLSYEYKDKPISEKGWVLYDNLCNLGRDLRQYIKTENDKSQVNKVRDTMNNYLKYIPASDEMKEMTSNHYISIENFVQLYVDPVDLTLDEDLVYPYQWPLNV